MCRRPPCVLIYIYTLVSSLSDVLRKHLAFPCSTPRVWPCVSFSLTSAFLLRRQKWKKRWREKRYCRPVRTGFKHLSIQLSSTSRSCCLERVYFSKCPRCAFSNFHVWLQCYHRYTTVFALSRRDWSRVTDLIGNFGKKADERLWACGCLVVK